MRLRSAAGLRAIAMAAIVARGTAFAQVGPDFQVNTATFSHQRQAALAVSDTGNFVVVWNSYYQDGSVIGGVFGQRYSGTGTGVGSEFQINTFTTGHQIHPAVGFDAAGNFVVAWTSHYQDASSWAVEAQRHNAAGSRAGSEFQVNTWTPNHQYFPAIAVDDSGDFVVVWSSYAQDGSGWGIFGQRYDSAGNRTGSEFRINTFTPSHQTNPAVATDDIGNFVVVWQGNGQDGSGDGVFGQLYDAAGNGVGGEFRVNTLTVGAQQSPSVAMDDAGNFVVVWADSASEGSGLGVLGRRYDSSGNALGSDFQVNTWTGSDQRYPGVAADASGNFIVTWESFASGNQFDVAAQRFDASGTRVGSEFVVNSFTTGNQRLPSIAASAGGKFVAAWQSDTGDGFGFSIRAAVVDPGAPVGPDGPGLASTTATFGIYNQGRGGAAQSHVRALLSDHGTLDTHVLGDGRDQELTPMLVSDLSCTGEGCTPPLLPGQTATYQATFEHVAGGLGRLEPGTTPGNGAIEDEEAGTFTLVADGDTDSVVSWLPGRYLWIVADSALDEGGGKLDEAGQTLPVLLGNDAQKKLLSLGAPTFGELTHLIADFEALAGSSGGDNPRLVVHFGGAGVLVIRLSDADAGQNLIGDGDPVRFDTTGLPTYQDSTTDYATAVAAAGELTISRIDFVLDDPGGDPYRQYRLDSIVVAASPSEAAAVRNTAAADCSPPRARFDDPGGRVRSYRSGRREGSR